jgi:hypothetical protein
MEEKLSAQNKKTNDLSLAEWEDLWQQVKSEKKD